MWGHLCTELTNFANFNVSFSTHKSEILIHLSQWQYWWWFWFSFFWTFYFFTILRLLKHRVFKMNPKLNTSLRSRGKWGDYLVTLIPLSWCVNILLNSNYILRMIEWQSESNNLILRIHGKQWYWVYKYDLSNIYSIHNTPRSVGSGGWYVRAPSGDVIFDKYLNTAQIKINATSTSDFWESALSKEFNPSSSFSTVLVGKGLSAQNNILIESLQPEAQKLIDLKEFLWISTPKNLVQEQTRSVVNFENVKTSVKVFNANSKPLFAVNSLNQDPFLPAVFLDKKTKSFDIVLPPFFKENKLKASPYFPNWKLRSFLFEDAKPQYSIFSKPNINIFQIETQPKPIDFTKVFKFQTPEKPSGTQVDAAVPNFDATATKPSTPTSPDDNKNTTHTFNDNSKTFINNYKFDESFIKKLNFSTVSSQKGVFVFTKNSQAFIDIFNKRLKKLINKPKNSPLIAWFADEYKILFSKNINFKLSSKYKKHWWKLPQIKSYKDNILSWTRDIKMQLNYLQQMQDDLAENYLPASKKTVNKIINKFNYLLSERLKVSKSFDRAKLLTFLLQNTLTFRDAQLRDYLPINPKKMTGMPKNLFPISQPKKLFELFNDAVQQYVLMNKALAYMRTLKPWLNKQTYYVKSIKSFADRGENSLTIPTKSVTIDKLSINRLIKKQTKQILKNNLIHPIVYKTAMPVNNTHESQLEHSHVSTSTKDPTEKTKQQQPSNINPEIDSSCSSLQSYDNFISPQKKFDICNQFTCNVTKTSKELPEWVFGISTNIDGIPQSGDLKGFVLERDQFGNPVPHEFPRRRNQPSTTNNLILKPELFSFFDFKNQYLLKDRYFKIFDFIDLNAFKFKKHKKWDAISEAFKNKYLSGREPKSLFTPAAIPELFENWINVNTFQKNAIYEPSNTLTILSATPNSLFTKQPSIYFYENQTLDDMWEVYSNLTTSESAYPIKLINLKTSSGHSKEFFKIRFIDSNELTAQKIDENVDFLVIKQKRYKRKQAIRPYSFNDFNGSTHTALRFFKNNLIIEQLGVTGLKHPFDLYSSIRLNRQRSESFSVNLSRRLLRTTRTLVLPAFTNISLIANSYDVVHSWFIPGLGIKIDCVPGKSTHHSLYIDNVGLYYGQCAEICGRYHHHMPIRVCALPFEHFLVWWTTKGLPKALKMKYTNKKFNDIVLKKYAW